MSAAPGWCPCHAARWPPSGTRSSRWTTAVELRVCSDLLANEKVPERSDDPRAASVPTDPLTAETYRATGLDGVLVHRTERSGQRVAVAVSHLLEGPGTVTTSGDCTARTAYG